MNLVGDWSGGPWQQPVSRHQLPPVAQKLQHRLSGGGQRTQLGGSLAHGLDVLSLDPSPLPAQPFANGVSALRPTANSNPATASATNFGQLHPPHNSRALTLDDGTIGGGATAESAAGSRSRLRSSSASRTAFAAAEPTLFDGGAVGWAPVQPRASSPEATRRSTFLGPAPNGDALSNGARQSRSAIRKGEQSSSERTPGTTSIFCFFIVTARYNTRIPAAIEVKDFLRLGALIIQIRTCPYRLHPAGRPAAEDSAHAEQQQQAVRQVCIDGDRHKPGRGRWHDWPGGHQLGAAQRGRRDALLPAAATARRVRAAAASNHWPLHPGVLREQSTRPAFTGAAHLSQRQRERLRFGRLLRRAASSSANTAATGPSHEFPHERNWAGARRPQFPAERRRCSQRSAAASAFRASRQTCAPASGEQTDRLAPYTRTGRLLSVHLSAAGAGVW